jgi:hypothetical protein
MLFFLVGKDRMNVYEKAGFVSAGTTQSSGQQVTIAYPKRNERREVTLLLEINSRDRNLVQYPNASEFRFRLFRPLKDIVKLQIAGGTVPGCLYNLNTGWNQFTFQEATRKWNVTIPPGRYTYETVCTKLASVLNSLSGVTNTYSVFIDATTGTLTLQRTAGVAEFAFLFLTGDYIDFYDQNNTLQKINTPAKLLGFGRADYTNTGSIITAPFVVDLEFLLNRAYVYINHDNTQDLNTIERSVGRQQPHAIVYFDELRNNYKFLNKETFEPLYCSYPAPISRIATIDISLRDEFDRCVDFNGRDFTLLLEVVYLD